MKRIAVLKWSFDNIGGGEKVAINLSNELSDLYEVALISFNSSRELFYPLKEGVEYINLGFGRKRVRNGFIPNTIKLVRTIKKLKINLIISVGSPTIGFMIIASLFSLFNIKTIYAEQSNPSRNDLGKLHLFQQYLAVKYADKIVTLTSQGKRIYTESYDINPDKITVIHNWIDNTHHNVKYDSNCKKLVTVGRFHPEKGYNFVIDIAKKIYKKYPDWCWDIYGDGDEEIMKNLSNIPNIKLKGIVKGIENIFPNHSIYVMTSYYEGLPLVLLEAKQFKLPIISFRCPTGPSEIVRDGTNGFLVDCYDADLMLDKLSLLIENVELRQKFSNNAILDIDKFSKATIIKQWLNLIDDL